MKSHLTSYAALFGREGAGLPSIERIEIPIIQRDYAQGRDEPPIARIRANFLDELRAALAADGSLGLDFVYGEVKDKVFQPLDGQQRLTTLFLLHWYLAWRTGRSERDAIWRRFEYATRPSARSFCAQLASASPAPAAKLRPWFEDQAWFLSTWQHDPTIQSMLTMIDAIHERFADSDCTLAWGRLTDPDRPAITFHLLPIEQLGLSEDLYLKMNSRGKPLTSFENFKARFEQLLEKSCPSRIAEFAQKIDGDWADVVWPLHGSDNNADDELLRYLQFVTELCAWEHGLEPDSDIDALAEQVYGPSSPAAAGHLDFLVRSLDTWVGQDTSIAFSSLFSLVPTQPDDTKADRVVLFGPQWGTVNLFTRSCRERRRQDLPHTLLFYAVLLNRFHSTEAFPRRLRHLRNLIEASSNELRAERLPALLADVRTLIIEGVLDGISAFNQAQVSEEKLKQQMLVGTCALEQPLFLLEDHSLLRGSLGAFELEGSAFEGRARAFHELFADEQLLPSLTGALLACGQYAHGNTQRFQLASSSDLTQWRTDILAGRGRAQLAPLRSALGRLLDAVKDLSTDMRSKLNAVSNEWLTGVERASGLDWRWYLIRYSEMREGRSGNYVCSDLAGYSMCMLEKKTTGSYYRDAFLYAVRCQAGVSGTSVYGSVWQTGIDGPWFTGYESQPRWMRLAVSGIELRCVENGFQLRLPSEFAGGEQFDRIARRHGIDQDLLLKIPQTNVGDYWLDTEDRVQTGAGLLRELCAAGF